MTSCHHHSESGYTTMRKGRKLLAEKRRRGRINHCLGEIKEIVCQSTQRKDPNYEKMEKAEILETTVDYLRNVSKITRTQQETKETIQARFQQGFSKCAEEMLAYIQSVPGVSDNLQRQLRKHLSRRVSHEQQVPATSSPQPLTTSMVSSQRTLHPGLRHQMSNIEVSSHDVHCIEHERVNPTERSQAVVDTSHNDSGYTSSQAVVDTSHNDSGYTSSPEVSRFRNLSGCPTSRPGCPTGCVSDSELYMAEYRMPTSGFDHSRVTEWVKSTWSYAQQVKVEQTSPWRPW